MAVLMMFWFVMNPGKETLSSMCAVCVCLCANKILPSAKNIYRVTKMNKQTNKETSKERK